MGIGIDLVYVPRVRGKAALAARILAPEERVQYEKRVDKDRFLAGRFAAKEAFFKAYGTGLGPIPFHDVAILNDRTGAPILSYAGKTYPVSISHDGDYAVAIVIIEG